MPTVHALCAVCGREKKQAWKEVARHPQLSARPAGPTGVAQEEHLSLQQNASAAGLHHTTFARLRVSVYTYLRMCSNLTCPFYLASLGCWLGSAGERGTGTATTIPRLESYSDFTCVQPMDRDYLTCLAWLTLWPSWCNNGVQHSLLPPATPPPVPADRIPGLRLSAGLMAHQTLTGLNCSAARLAQSSPKHTLLPTQSFTHWPLDVRPSYARSLVPTTPKGVDQTLHPDGIGKACACTV